MPITRDDCLALDASDPLRACRARFMLDEGLIYLDGNSLGALPRGVAEHVANVVKREWGEGLIRSWNEAGWYVSPARVGAKLAPLLGAQPHEVTVTESISINLFKLLVAAARMRPDRQVILAEHGNFPSDNHIVDSVARLLGKKARFVPAGEIAAAVDADTGVATLSHVNYRSAEVQDMAAVTKAAHAKGALIVWDLAHSSGAVDVQLDKARADFAVGCGYKFLNGGPGAPSHIFVAERHLGFARPAAHRLVRPCRALPLRRRLSARRRHPPYAVLDAADAVDGGIREGARRFRRRLDGRGRAQGPRARRLHDRASRRTLERARLRPCDLARRRHGAATMSRSRMRQAMR